jgi:HEPN domain-containing protein
MAGADAAAPGSAHPGDEAAGAAGAAEAAPPSAETLRRAQTFWQQGQADLKEARRKLRARSYVDASYLSFQAALNALTSLAHLHGEPRAPNFSTLRLASLLEGYDPALAPLRAAAEALEEAQALNPYAAQRDAAEERRRARLYYAHGAAILKQVRAWLKARRRRFFAP